MIKSALRLSGLRCSGLFKLYFCAREKAMKPPDCMFTSISKMRDFMTSKILNKAQLCK